MPDNNVRLDDRQLDLVLHYNIQQLTHIRSFSYHAEKEGTSNFEILNSPIDTNSATKNLVIIKSLNIATVAHLGYLEALINKAINHIKEHSLIPNVDPHVLEFIVPVLAQDHWILLMLAPAKKLDLQEVGISYIPDPLRF